MILRSIFILSEKPGWARWSLHPTMTNNEVDFSPQAVKEISEKFWEWSKDYVYQKKTNEFLHKSELNRESESGIIRKWFDL